MQVKVEARSRTPFPHPPPVSRARARALAPDRGRRGHVTPRRRSASPDSPSHSISITSSPSRGHLHRLTDYSVSSPCRPFILAQVTSAALHAPPCYGRKPTTGEAASGYAHLYRGVLFDDNDGKAAIKTSLRLDRTATQQPPRLPPHTGKNACQVHFRLQAFTAVSALVLPLSLLTASCHCASFSFFFLFFSPISIDYRKLVWLGNVQHQNSKRQLT